MPDMIIAITLLLLSSAAHPLKQLRHFDKILGQIVNTHLYFERQFVLLGIQSVDRTGNDSNLLIVFYVQIMPDDFVMQLHRF